MRGTNVCIWKLEKSLAEIIPLLSEDYSKIIAELQEYELPEDEKKLICTWKEEGKNGYSIKELEVGENIFSFVKAIAHIEIHSLPKSDIILPNGEPLPKDIRVKHNNSRTIFVESSNSVYCIVSGAKSMEGRIRSNLMQSRLKDSKWGKIDFNGVREYTFNKKFYYWILKNKDNKLNIKNKEMLLMDVKGFKSNSNRKAHSYSGEGANIGEEIPLKSIVSMDEALISLYIKVLYKDITYSFYLDHDGRLLLQATECGKFASQNAEMISEEKLIFTIYFDIIPFLIQNYNIALKNGWQDEEIKFKKKSSIDVIAELMRQNNLNLDDLKKAKIS